MPKTDVELAHKRFLGFVWLSLICFFNTVPLFVISILANLDSVCFNLLFLTSDDIRLFFADQSIRPLLAKVVRGFSVFVYCSVGCVATIHFWIFHLLLAPHHALVDESSSHLVFTLSTVLLIVFFSVYGSFDTL